jgi:hypothetical protein
MSATQYLSDEVFAQYFRQANTVVPGADVLDLEPRVQAWLDRAGMGHRRAFPIAIEVSKLARKEPAPVRMPSPEQAAFEVNQAEGIGDQVPDVASMSMADYGKARQRLIRRSSGDGVGLFGPVGR